MSDQPDRVWFTLDAEAKPVGPYTVADLAGYAAAGYVTEAQVFWKEGNAGWEKAADIPELTAVDKARQEFSSKATQQQGAGAAATEPQQQPGPTTQQPHPQPHVRVFSAKPSDPLDAFKHEIAAVEAAGPDGVGAGGAADAAAVGAGGGGAAVDGGDEERGGTPEELEFEDDDGTIYKWDRQLRKYMPAGEAAEAIAAAAAGGGGADAGAAKQQQQQDGGSYDIEAMTFVAEEEVIPTLAAVRAAEEAAAEAAEGGGGGGKGKKRAGADAGGEGGQQGNKKAKASAAAGDEAEAAAAGAAADGGKKDEQQQPGWNEPKKNTSVYVAGLPPDTDVDEVAGVFAKCGIIKLDDTTGQPRIKLYKDKESGELKGDALVTYLKVPSVDLACQILDGTPLRPNGPNMSVSAAKFEMKGGQFIQGANSNNPAAAAAGAGAGGGKKGGGKKGGGRGGGRGGGKGRGGRGQPSVQEKLERRLGWGGFDDLLPPEKVTVVLKRLFTPAEAADGGATFVSELEADVTTECKRLGTIEKVRVFPQHPEGVVTVRFKQAEPAEQCVALMDGRFFGGRQLVAHMWDGFTQFHGVKAVQQESAEDEEARLEAFARELEAKQQQAAE